MITDDRWLQAHHKEQHFWGNVMTNFDQLMKEDAFYRYEPVLGLDTDDVEGKTVIDIGGGPISIMYHFNLGVSAIVDPLAISQELLDKYSDRGIIYFQRKAEDFLLGYPGAKYDEVWMYNCLLHVQDPWLILDNLRNVASILRIGEPINTKIDEAHPHQFTVQQLTDALTQISIAQRFLSRQYDYLYFGGVFELK